MTTVFEGGGRDGMGWMHACLLGSLAEIKLEKIEKVFSAHVEKNGRLGLFFFFFFFNLGEKNCFQYFKVAFQRDSFEELPLGENIKIDSCLFGVPRERLLFKH
jgi:hypothetical protein